MQIRSYTRVFDFERRIYRIDRLRLNPGGVPVRGIVYFLVLLGGSLVAARLPLVDVAMRAAPWYARDLVMPAALAALLTMIRVEGRPFHLAARALLRLWLTPRQTTRMGAQRERAIDRLGCRWHPEPILLLPDGSDCRARRLRYTGPGALLVSVAHERKAAGGPLVWLGLRSHVHVHVRRTQNDPPARREVVVLERATRLCVR
jgi:hypothetical protein